MKKTTTPDLANALLVLLKSDFITQWRNRRSLQLMLLVPIVVLITKKGDTNEMTAVFLLSTCITIGLTAIGLMGYADSIVRDRDKGVFLRLRVTPVPAWCFMLSRILIQLGMISLLATAVFVCGYFINQIKLSPTGYLLGFTASIFSGALYLGLGQMIAGLFKRSSTVNNITKVIYFVFIGLGMFGGMGKLGAQIKEIVQWSPFGTVNIVLSASLHPTNWNFQASMAVLLTIVYAAIFTCIGIRLFKWDVR